VTRPVLHASPEVRSNSSPPVTRAPAPRVAESISAERKTLSASPWQVACGRFLPPPPLLRCPPVRHVINRPPQWNVNRPLSRRKYLSPAPPPNYGSLGKRTRVRFFIAFFFFRLFIESQPFFFPPPLFWYCYHPTLDKGRDGTKFSSSKPGNSLLGAIVKPLFLSPSATPLLFCFPLRLA